VWLCDLFFFVLLVFFLFCRRSMLDSVDHFWSHMKF